MAESQYGLAISGLGEGALRGLELARQHERQDAEAERRESAAERKDQMFGLRRESQELGIDQQRNQMEHRSEMRPMQRDSAELGLQSDRQAVESGERSAALEEMELEAQRRATETDKALRGFAAGNLGVVQDWYNSYAPEGNGIEEIGRTKDGSYRIQYTEGDMETVSRDELGTRIAGMASPDSWLEQMTQTGEGERFGQIQRQPGLGYGQYGPDGEWHSIDPESGGAADASRTELDGTTVSSIRKAVDRKLTDTFSAYGVPIYDQDDSRELATLSERVAQRMYVNSGGQAVPVGAADEAMSAVADARRQARHELGERIPEDAETQLTAEAEADWVRRRTREMLGLDDSGLGRESGGQDASAGGAPPATEGGGQRGIPVPDESGPTATPTPTARGRESTPSAGTETPTGGGGQSRGEFVGTNGNGEQVVVTRGMIEETARKHGKTVQQVISDLNLQPRQ